MYRSAALDRKFLAFGRAVSLSALNQAISSVTNLLLVIFFARALSPAEFGLYGIGFSAALLFGSVGNALILTQMAVHFPEKSESETAKYAARMFWLTVALCAGLLAAALCTSLLLLATAEQVVTPELLLAGAIASVSYLAKDFFVRLSYSQRSVSSAIAINASVAVAVFMGSALAVACDAKLSAVTALLLFSLGQMLGAVVGALRSRLPLFACDPGSVFRDFRQAWCGGRWAVGGAFVIWLQSQAYVYITAITVGAAAVGYANAARIFVSPFLSLLPAVSQIMLPRMASLRVSEEVRVFATAKRYLVAMTVLLGLYLTVLALAFGLASRILGPQYSSQGMLVALWGLVLMAQVSRDSASTTMQSLRRFREILARNLWSAGAAVVMAAILSSYFGVSGAVISVAIGEMILSVLLWRYLIKNQAPVRRAS